MSDDEQTSRPIAFATYGSDSAISADDGFAVPLIAERMERRIEGVSWDADGVEWDRYSAVLIRSTWDYHLRPDRFLAWVDSLEAKGIAVWNPAPVVRWNAEKGYLRDLERAGVPIVPTVWIPRGTVPDLSAAARRTGWERVIVKPSISAGSFRTWLADVRDLPTMRRDLTSLLRHADALLQPFLPQVRTEGEWSFVFFSARSGTLEFSHAAVKRPASGDFRVQSQHGGSVVPAEPPPALLRQVAAIAGSVERLAPGPLLYARLDGVVDDGTHAGAGTFLLMEAELIEPRLYLGCAELAAARFAEAVANRLAGAPSTRAGFSAPAS
jgi:hypothetical protein